MKKALFPVLALGAAGVAYYLWSEKQKLRPTVPGSNASNTQNANPGSASQPSQLYPWSPIVPPRVDNANQPWYNGSKAAMLGPVSDVARIGEFSQSVVAGSSVIHSLEDVWGRLQSVFGGNPEKEFLQSTDSMPTSAVVSNADMSEAYTPAANVWGENYDANFADYV